MNARRIRDVLSKFPLLGHRWRNERWVAGRTFWDADYLARLGFEPQTLVDVGVAYGSPYPHDHSLYEAYPDAFLVLVEPLVEFKPYLREILLGRRGIHLETALGDADGEALIQIDHNWIERSSIETRTPLEYTGEFSGTRTVPVTTLDAMLHKHRFEPPFGLKIDTEGWEYRVVNGATEFLKNTQFVIAEVDVADRFVDGYSFADFIALMDRLEFSACDFLDIGRAPDSSVTFIDILFRKNGEC
jgi:FkbM family methyltransferase